MLVELNFHLLVISIYAYPLKEQLHNRCRIKCCQIFCLLRGNVWRRGAIQVIRKLFPPPISLLSHMTQIPQNPIFHFVSSLIGSLNVAAGQQVLVQLPSSSFFGHGTAWTTDWPQTYMMKRKTHKLTEPARKENTLRLNNQYKDSSTRQSVLILCFITLRVCVASKKWQPQTSAGTWDLNTRVQPGHLIGSIIQLLCDSAVGQNHPRIPEMLDCSGTSLKIKQSVISGDNDLFWRLYLWCDEKREWTAVMKRPCEVKLKGTVQRLHISKLLSPFLPTHRVWG